MTPEMELLDELTRFAGVGREYRLSGGNPKAQSADALVRLGYATRTAHGIALTQAGERRGRDMFERGESRFLGWGTGKWKT